MSILKSKREVADSCSELNRKRGQTYDVTSEDDCLLSPHEACLANMAGTWPCIVHLCRLVYVCDVTGLFALSKTSLIRM